LEKLCGKNSTVLAEIEKLAGKNTRGLDKKGNRW